MDDEGGGGSRARSGDREEDYGDYFGPEPDLEDRFTGMKLHGEEGEDLDFSAEVDELI